MAIIRMDMCSHEVERVDEVESDLGCEFKEGGWNPALQLQQIAMSQHRRSLPTSLAGVDVDAFVGGMCVC